MASSDTPEPARRPADEPLPPSADEPPVSGGSGGDPGQPGDEAWGSRKALEVLALAFVFPATVYVGFAAGRWVGGQLGAPGAGSLVGLVLGAAAAFWELYEYVRRLAPR